MSLSFSSICRGITPGSHGEIYLGAENRILGREFTPEQTGQLLGSHPVQLDIDGRRYYSEPLVRPGGVCIFGGGHVAQELVPVLAHLGFRCTVMDDRPDFANPGMFPQAEEVITGDFSRISDFLTVTPNDYLVVMTRGHSFDYEVQVQAMRTGACYIGVIGSKSKAGIIAQKLSREGFSQEEINRVHSPIGINIASETQAEIAVSIAAQLIQVRAEGAAR